jgi:hypothetical protein
VAWRGVAARRSAARRGAAWRGVTWRGVAWRGVMMRLKKSLPPPLVISFSDFSGKSLVISPRKITVITKITSDLVIFAVRESLNH